MNNDSITIIEAAALRNITARTIRRWCELGWIDARQSGKVWLIDRASLINFTPPKRGQYERRRK